MKHLAKKIYYALNYLHDSMIQDSWAANDRTVDDAPLSLSKVETVHEINVGPALSPFCVCFCVEEDAPLLRLLGAPSEK